MAAPLPTGNAPSSLNVALFLAAGLNVFLMCLWIRMLNMFTALQREPRMQKEEWHLTVHVFLC